MCNLQCKSEVPPKAHENIQFVRFCSYLASVILLEHSYIAALHMKGHKETNFKKMPKNVAKIKYKRERRQQDKIYLK